MRYSRAGIFAAIRNKPRPIANGFQSGESRIQPSAQYLVNGLLRMFALHLFLFIFIGISVTAGGDDKTRAAGETG